jgi:hypothetical protein
LEERLLEKIEYDPNGGCWLWSGSTICGYGGIRDERGVKIKAHRAAWMLWRGPIPFQEGYFGACVCHHCDTPACVNPEHLFIGTHADNMNDKAKKERVRHSKLRAIDIPVIRHRLKAGEYQRVIAADYGVTREAIKQIKIGRAWAHA